MLVFLSFELNDNFWPTKLSKSGRWVELQNSGAQKMVLNIFPCEIWKLLKFCVFQIFSIRFNYKTRKQEESILFMESIPSSPSVSVVVSFLLFFVHVFSHTLSPSLSTLVDAALQLLLCGDVII